MVLGVNGYAARHEGLESAKNGGDDGGQMCPGISESLSTVSGEQHSRRQ